MYYNRKQILDRLYDSYNQTKPAFALYGTVHWMRGLKILIEKENFDNDSLIEFYSGINKKIGSVENENKVLEMMLMAYHYHATLVENVNSDSDNYTQIRAMIISWYYSIYFSGSAMLCAEIGGDFDNHMKTADVWLSEISKRGLVLPPFDFNLNSLIKDEYLEKIKELKDGNTCDLNTLPVSDEDGLGAVLTYLKGCADWYREKNEKDLLNSREFRDEGLGDFRKKIAREKRDNRLKKKKVGFLHQAFRYRGKVNYRDSMFLTYGDGYNDKIDILTKDLVFVSEAWQKMISAFLYKKFPKGEWEGFINDMVKNSCINVGPNYLKID